MPRPRKSLDHHELAGTTPAYVEQEPSTFAAGRPKMPKDLSPVAAAEWKRITKELGKRATLTRVDSSALETYCRLFAQWRGYCAHVDKHGEMIEEPVKDKNGEVFFRHVQNPAGKMALQLGNAVRMYQKEFSATPASREKTRPAAPPAPKNEEYPEGSIGWLLKKQAAGLLGGNNDEQAGGLHDDHSDGKGTGDSIALDFDV